MFILQETPIDIAKFKKAGALSNTGAFVSFEGLVRADELKDGRVNALMYVAEAPACMLEGEQILKEARAQFPIDDAVCVQRIGTINAGETAVWIGVGAGHRDEAFKACRFIIEEIKKRLLIWKKEFFTNGESQWVYGPQTPTIT